MHTAGRWTATAKSASRRCWILLLLRQFSFALPLLLVSALRLRCWRVAIPTQSGCVKEFTGQRLSIPNCQKIDAYIGCFWNQSERPWRFRIVDCRLRIERGREKGEGRREKGEGSRERGERRREKGEGSRERGERSPLPSPLPHLPSPPP